MVALAVLLFAITYQLDSMIAAGNMQVPGWAIAGGSDAARQVLIGIAAAVITVAGVVFSITILALQLASQQFGPRMLRNFIRDRGTQVSLGAFVATFVYSILTLGSVAHQSSAFVPHISVTVALILTLGDLGVLIYFIHHVAQSIQLTTVVSGIARDFRMTIHDLNQDAAATRTPMTAGPGMDEIRLRLETGAPVPTQLSGFLQAVGHDRLVRIAASSDAVIKLLHRPGHFVIAGRPFATVYPRQAAGKVAAALGKAHATGPHRTLSQDPVFAIDQLVEIAIRALSPAVNDTFTALTCIDWLCDGLCKLSGRRLSEGVYRDRLGRIRLIEAGPSYARMVNRAFDKVRQAGRGMPAVAIRQVDALARVMEYTADPARQAVLVRQASMIVRAVDEAVPEVEDRALVHARYADVLAAARDEA